MDGRKNLDLSQSVHDLCGQYPEAMGILEELGFRDIARPGMLQTAGRFMTIPKGAAMKKIPMEAVVEAFRQRGFEVDEKEEGK